ncbi:MAG: 4-hydroxy-tetrahydrodipicolinate synthase [Bacteroidota bacterium]
MESLLGTGVALVTPFNSNQEIDYAGLKKLLNFTADKGVDYYVVLGTTGESATLTPSEKAQILEFVKKNNANHLPIVYGIGGNNTSEILRSITSSDLNGVDAVLSVSPYYNKPSQQGIFQHYTRIADKSPVPIILYNVPGRTGSNITADTTLRLAAHSNIIGIKEASRDLEQAMKIVKGKPSDFMLISGEDMLSIPLYALGASGVISVLANAFSNVFKAVYEAVKSNDFEKATAHMLRLLEINPLMYEQSNPVGVKQVLEYFGICENHVRLPLVSASQELKNRITSILADPV